MQKIFRSSLIAASFAVSSLVVTSLLASSTALATIVQVKTNVGDFEINLFDEITPVTVQNFLNYVSSERYDGTVIHRLLPGFVAQGGGFRFSGQLPLQAISTNAAIINEPKLSNVRGTIAMAKLGNDANSATNQWYINLADNSSNLDRQNGGFTVFGQISSADMQVLDAMAALPRFNFGGLLENLPLRNYTTADRLNNTPLVAHNFITIESIVVVDSRANTAAGLNPVPNTPINAQEPATSSGGSSSWLWLGALLACVCRRRSHT
ncbi:peptidylprolyl isomerase [Arsukibacterium sp.]|uniref:peptidylprolyl isomerase n=1 Tax=Arsukibacterium sp. TaxID=1977258 RepID=UPI002FD8F2A9